MGAPKAQDAVEAWGSRARRAAWVIAGCGVLLRVIRIGHGQSLYADALGADLVGRTLGDVLVPLEFVPPEPVGYLLLVMVVVALAGLSELALRLVPLLCGCLAVVLLIPTVRRILPPRGGLVALGLVALAWRMIDYSALSKPYMMDVLAAVALVLATLRLRDDPTSRRRCLELAALGVVATLVSFPSVFVLGGVVVALAGHVRRRAALVLLLVWAAIFSLHYWGVIAGQWDTAWAERVWGHRFAPFPPGAVEEWVWYPRHVVGPVRCPPI